MARGGKREGAGRKQGVPNRKTAETVAAVEASGLTPLDYMLSVLRDEAAEREQRMWAAEKAAPFVHPRLAAIEHSGGMTFTHEDALDELDEQPGKGDTPPAA